MSLVLKDVQAEWVQEQVLPVDNLVEVKAGVAVFGNDRLLDRILLFQRVHLVQLLRADKSVMFTF